TNSAVNTTMPAVKYHVASEAPARQIPATRVARLPPPADHTGPGLSSARQRANMYRGTHQTVTSSSWPRSTDVPSKGAAAKSAPPTSDAPRDWVLSRQSQYAARPSIVRLASMSRL